jgi:hypothetical protein
VEDVHSCTYIAFRTKELVVRFSRNYVFEDTQDCSSAILSRSLLSRRNMAANRPHRLAYDPQRGLWPPLQSLSRHSFNLAPRRSRRPETYPLLHPWPNLLIPFRARASPDEAASINRSYFSRLQVEPHRRPLHFRVPPHTPVSRLRANLHLLDGQRALEDSCCPCLRPLRSSSRWPSIVLVSRKAGSRSRKRGRDGKGVHKDGASSLKDGAGRKEEGGRHMGYGPAAVP